MTEDQKAYEAKTVATDRGETIAQLREAFDAVCNKEDWKLPWAAYIPVSKIGIVLRAVEFFHGDNIKCGDPDETTGNILVYGNGYQAY